MAHYAFLDENNIVTEVIVGIDETETIEGLDPETWYSNFRGQVCKRTSYNSNIRGRYAGIGFFYNASEDIFVEPQPFPSWIRTGAFWVAPIEKPNDGNFYFWDEDTNMWKLQTIPDEVSPAPKLMDENGFTITEAN
jgi:hypothetical protein